MRRWLCTIFFLAMSFGFVPTSGAANVTEAEARQVRSVVEAQLKALRADDGPAAFALAAPSIRGLFGSPDRFLAMVRSGYPVVYRPASVAYLKADKVSAVAIVQGVHLTDGEGTLWLALYHLERQRDKTWRIAGCQVTPAQGRVA